MMCVPVLVPTYSGRRGIVAPAIQQILVPQETNA